MFFFFRIKEDETPQIYAEDNTYKINSTYPYPRFVAFLLLFTRVLWPTDGPIVFRDHGLNKVTTQEYYVVDNINDLNNPKIINNKDGVNEEKAPRNYVQDSVNDLINQKYGVNEDRKNGVNQDLIQKNYVCRPNQLYVTYLLFNTRIRPMADWYNPFQGWRMCWSGYK